jgi:hypothetical protein
MVSLKARVTATLTIVFCWLIFTISFLAFYPTGFDIWKNVAFFIVSGLIACGMVVLIWIRMISW